MRSMRLALLVVPLAALLFTAQPVPSHAVEIEASIRDGSVHLYVPGVYWDYTIDRADRADGPFETLAYEYIGCTENCEYLDREPEPGATFWYRFDLIERAGGRVQAGPIAVTIPTPPGGILSCACAPNPFEDATAVSFRIPGRLVAAGAARVEASIHDLSGRRVRLLHQGPLGQGDYTLAWDGTDEAGRAQRNGVYFYRVRVGEIEQTGRLLKIR